MPSRLQLLIACSVKKLNKHTASNQKLEAEKAWGYGASVKFVSISICSCSSLVLFYLPSRDRKGSSKTW